MYKQELFPIKKLFDQPGVNIEIDNDTGLYYAKIAAGFKMYAGTTGADNMYMHKRISENYAWYGSLNTATNYEMRSCPYATNSSSDFRIRNASKPVCLYAFKLKQDSRFILLSEPYNLYKLHHMIQDEETRFLLEMAYPGLKTLVRTQSNPEPYEIEGTISRNSRDDIDKPLFDRLYPLIESLGYQGYAAYEMSSVTLSGLSFHEEIMVINPDKLLERDFSDPMDFSNSSELSRIKMLNGREDKFSELSDHSVWTLLYVEKLMNRYGAIWNIDNDNRKLIALAALVHDEKDVDRIIEGFQLTTSHLSLIKCVQNYYGVLESYVRQVAENFSDYIIIETEEYSNNEQNELYTKCSGDTEQEVCLIPKVFGINSDTAKKLGWQYGRPLRDERISIYKEKEAVRPLTYLVKDTPNCDYYYEDEVKRSCLEDAKRDIILKPGPKFESLKDEYLEKISFDCRDKLTMKAILLVSMASVIGLVPYGAGHINQDRNDIDKGPTWKHMEKLNWKQPRTHMTFSTTFPQIRNRFLNRLISEHYERSREMRKIGLVVSELLMKSIKI